jgi:tRNA-Thr(GGU) m(6)t(6)A37 methyltransferase TsaA
MLPISAQVSLYPLRQEGLSNVIDAALDVFIQHGLEVQTGPMSTLISGDDEVVFAALREAFQFAGKLGQVVMVTTFSNACPLPEKKESKISFSAIGHVENLINELVPASEIRAEESRIVLNPDTAGGLQGIKPGQQIMVIFNFHRSEGFDLLQHPQGDQSRPKRGVFTLRSPKRPNPIGVTVAELVGVKDNILYLCGLDAINGTPVLDLKPVI